MKRWKAANPLFAGEDFSGSGPDTLEVLINQDDARIHVSRSDPIQTEFSLAMEDVRVASTAFVGERCTQTADDVRPKVKEDFEPMGFDYVAWDGRCIVRRAYYEGCSAYWVAQVMPPHSVALRACNGGPRRLPHGRPLGRCQQAAHLHLRSHGKKLSIFEVPTRASPRRIQRCHMRHILWRRAAGAFSHHDVAPLIRL